MQAPPTAYLPPQYPGFSGYNPYQYPPCDPKLDAHALRKAFKGLGTDEKTVIQILANRSKPQLEMINREYKNSSESHHDLDHGLKHEISGNFLKLSLIVITPLVVVKKDTLREAVKGLGTREVALIDVLSQSSNAELAEIASDTKLREDIIGDVSGDFKKCIERILQAKRPEWGVVSEEQAAEIAHRFYKAGEGKVGTDEREYTEIILSNSRETLHLVDHVYKHKHKSSLAKAIKKETSGYFKDLLLALITPRHQYFAKRLHQAVAGLGTDERTINFIFGTLDRGELRMVAEEYKAMFKTSMEADLKGDTSGNYKDFLMAFLK